MQHKLFLEVTKNVKEILWPNLYRPDFERTDNTWCFCLVVSYDWKNIWVPPSVYFSLLYLDHWNNTKQNLVLKNTMGKYTPIVRIRIHFSKPILIRIRIINMYHFQSFSIQSNQPRVVFIFFALTQFFWDHTSLLVQLKFFLTRMVFNTYY